MCDLALVVQLLDQTIFMSCGQILEFSKSDLPTIPFAECDHSATARFLNQPLLLTEL